ncbi:DUF4255 domain-containing protein [Deinococcus deserti]|uniref:Pvc16 N-terminal domain-containing protein n=1 Tax=Deinococcus deserti (strain DSM 17065 / CIP 109153 / LMG 22923 / VCD115) TaxID=546414 RepID=C1D118_DEIDV|nr:DUF4255 domain-containing protein [Deinococcus deserti]ACO45542.1 hypothetical protein Deide_06840 [Deinococcus deserti VCD115]
MIADIQHALKELVYSEAALPRDALDVRFAAPTSAWVSGLTRPTLNFFLHDIRENMALRSSEFMHTYVAGGRQRDLVPRRIDLKYLVTVFFKSQVDELGRDEWNVLWRVLAALMRQDEWEDRYIPQAARDLDVGVLGVVGQPEGQASQGIFTSLGLPVRPHLNYTLTVPLNLNVSELSLLVLERRVDLRTGLEKPAADGPSMVRSSWIIRDEHGQAVADALVRSDQGGRAFSGPDGVVHLAVPREHVRILQVLTLDGQSLELPAQDAALLPPLTE